MFQKACIVETVAVVRRLSDKAKARKVSNGIMESYEICEMVLGGPCLRKEMQAERLQQSLIFN